MKNWPVRWRLIYLAAIIPTLTLLGFGIGVTVHLYRECNGFLDHSLANAAHEATKRLKGRPDFPWRNRHAVEDLMRNAQIRLYYEIRQPDGTLLYRSGNCGKLIFPRDMHGTQTLTSDDKDYRAGLFETGGLRFYMATDMDLVDEVRYDLLLANSCALPVALLILMAGGWLVSRKAMEPVDNIVRIAEGFSARKLDQRIPVPEVDDELRRLTLVLNTMIGRLEASFLQATRFTADASHQLKTPLTIMRSHLEDALRSRNCGQEGEMLLNDLLDQATHLTHITEKLLLLSRADAGKLQLNLTEFDLSAMLEDLVGDAHILAEPRRTTIHAAIPKGIHVQADEKLIWQMLMNLIENAVKYNREGGTVEVALSNGDGAARVSIANSGAGIPIEQQRRLFERFSRSTELHGRVEGHGLGLSIAREIARAHHGDVALAGTGDDKTEFVVRLPLQGAG